MLTKTKAVIYLLFILSLAVFCAAGCSGSDGGSGGDSGSSDATVSESASAETETSNGWTLQTVLARYDDIDLEGTTIRILTTNDINSAVKALMAPEEGNEDHVNMALLDRDNYVKEKLGCDIKYYLVSTDGTEMYNRVTTTCNSMSDEYDIIMGDVQNSTKFMLVNGYSADLSEFDILDFTNPWWNEKICDDYSLNDRVYFAVGDIAPRNFMAAFVMIFDKDGFKDRNLNMPYDTVTEGAWTLDAFNSTVKNVYSDVNNNGVPDNGDYFGYVGSVEHIDYLYEGLGGRYGEINGELSMTLCCDSSEMIDRMDALKTSFNTQDTYIGVRGYAVDSEFMKGDALMIGVTACNLTNFRDCNINYGLIPFPKYNEEQESYNTVANCWCLAGFCIPITSPQPNEAATVGDALAAVGRYTTTTAVYEKLMMEKCTRDDESQTMLQLATDSMSFDPILYLGWGGLNSTAVYEHVMKNKSFTTYIAGKASAIQSDSEAFFEKFE